MKNWIPWLAIILLGSLVFASQESSDLKWINDYSDKSTNTLIPDKRFLELVNNFVPEVEIDLGMGRPHSLADTFLEFIGGPPDKVTRLQNGIVLSGCRAHSCNEKAWLWVDVKNQIVAGAMIHYVFQGEYSEKPSLLYFSKTPIAQSLSGDSRKALNEWLDRQKIEPVNIKSYRFVHKDGTIEELQSHL